MTIRPPNLAELLYSEDEVLWSPPDHSKPLEGVSDLLRAARETEQNKLLIHWRSVIVAVLDKSATEHSLRTLTSQELSALKMLRSRYPNNFRPPEFLHELGPGGSVHRWKDYERYWRREDE